MVEFGPMTATEFDSYCQRAIAEYADEHVQSGRWSAEEALDNAAREYQKLLPDGVATPNHFLYTLKDVSTHTPVGMLWYAIETKAAQQRAFIYDVRIDPAFRRQGYATQAFRALEDLVRTHGAQQIRLHVFGHNLEARALYEKLGYIATNINMAKTLDD